MRNVSVVFNLAAASAGMGAVLLAQVNWSIWQYEGLDAFTAYHVAWWYSVWWTIFCLTGIGFLGIIAQLIWRPNTLRWMVWVALLLQAAGYAGTIFWWVPGQGSLNEVLVPAGGPAPFYILFSQTNWARAAIYTIAGLLQLRITISHFAGIHKESMNLAAAVLRISRSHVLKESAATELRGVILSGIEGGRSETKVRQGIPASKPVMPFWINRHEGS
jgi:hypothetical protein